MESLPVLLLGCLAGLGFSLSGLFSGRRRRRLPRPAAAERSLHELRAGDIVQHGSSFLRVHRALQLVAAGRWRCLSELEADGAALSPLLLVGAEEAGEPDAAWLLYPLPSTRADLLPTPQAPATESLPHDGLRYRLLSRHHTAVRADPAAKETTDRAPSQTTGQVPSQTTGQAPSQTTGQAPSQTTDRSVDPAAAADARLSLLCYRGPAAHRLLVTRWAGEPSARLYAGERVLGESLVVLAGA